MLPFGAVINRRSGPNAGSRDAEARKLVQQLSGIIAPNHIRWVSGSRAGPEAVQLLEDGVRVLIAGGGDGTISAVAGIAADAKVPLGVLPLGTRNHFARDLGIPLEIDQAVQLLPRMHLRKVDLGEVNGKTFLNNVSLGMYPDMVVRRDAYTRRRGWRKMPAQILAGLTVLRRFSLRRIDIDIDGRRVRRVTPIFFVGNNAYRGGPLADQRRDELDSGQLWVGVVRVEGKISLLRACWAFARGRVNTVEQLEEMSGTELKVHFRRGTVRAAIDGEACRLETPLHFRSRPGALEVIVP